MGNDEPLFVGRLLSTVYLEQSLTWTFLIFAYKLPTNTQVFPYFSNILHDWEV